MSSRRSILLSAVVLASAGLLATPTMAQAPAKQAKVSLMTPSSWACAGRLVEIAPVSLDIAGRAEAWVLVHRVNGEVVASERLTREEVEQLQRLPCAPDESQAPLVG